MSNSGSLSTTGPSAPMGTDRLRDTAHGGITQSGGETDVATDAGIAGPGGGGNVNVANSLTLINEGSRVTWAASWFGQTVLFSFLECCILG